MYNDYLCGITYLYAQRRFWKLTIFHIMAQADTKPPLPPFTLETAKIKVKAAQNAWNTKDPHTVKNAYTPDCIWRNRDQFFRGTDAIVAFLTEKWGKENGYKLRKELFAFSDDKVCRNCYFNVTIADGRKDCSAILVRMV